jgi:hypothetical protein
MLQSPSRSRARTDSATPMLEKHRNIRDRESNHDISVMVDDERRDAWPNGGTEMRDRSAVQVLAGAHAASQAGPAQGYDATLERKLIRSQRKLDLARFRLNRVHDAGSNMTRVTEDLDKAIAELGAFLLIADPAQLLNDVMSSGTRLARSDYLQKLAKHETDVKSGYAKHGWNLVAGSVGNLLCFGIGGSLSTLAANPLLGLGVNTTLWTFAEPLISMMRATTFTNPYLDLYMVRQHLQARAAREALDGTSGLDRNKKFAWASSVDGETEWLNAADWLARTSWLTLWSGKHLTDDAPYHLYSAAYGAANCLPELISPALYDRTTWQGLAMLLGVRTGAGMMAGAALQECVQLLRAWQAKHTGGREIVTKTLSLWKDEAAWLGLLLADVDSQYSQVGIDPLRKQAYDTLRQSVLLWHEKAVAKSALMTSILYEWRAMVQSKRHAIGIDPEVPGKRLDTAASFIGKALSQVAGIAVGTLAPKAVKSAVPWIRWAGYLVPPLASIGAGGFIIRRELEASARVMLGVAQGLARRCCGGREVED